MCMRWPCQETQVDGRGSGNSACAGHVRKHRWMAEVQVTVHDAGRCMTETVFTSPSYQLFFIYFI